MAPPAWEQVLDLSVLYRALSIAARSRRAAADAADAPAATAGSAAAGGADAGDAAATTAGSATAGGATGGGAASGARCCGWRHAGGWRRWSLCRACYCLALCCHHRHIQPLGRAWLHGRKSATAVLASDLIRFPTLHSRHIYQQPTCPYPGMLHVQTGLESEGGSMSAVNLARRASSLANPSSDELSA